MSEKWCYVGKYQARSSFVQPVNEDVTPVLLQTSYAVFTFFLCHPCPLLSVDGGLSGRVPHRLSKFTLQ